MKRMAIVALAATLLLCICFGAAAYLPVSAGGQPPYRFSIDHMMGSDALKGGGTILHVLRDMEIPDGAPLTLQGWLATDEGVAKYQYLWVRSGGDRAEWQDVTSQKIHERGDLAAAGIPHVSGHKTAGFQLTVEPPVGTEDGYYDIYIRALDGMGQACDLLALLHTRYGDADPDNGQSRTISFGRLAGEGDTILCGGATVAENGITLPPGGLVRLGNLSVTGFEEVRITYSADTVDKKALIGLKSAGEYSYGSPTTAGGKYNMTDSLAYAGLPAASGTVTIPLSEVTHDGEVWLATWGDATVTVTEVTFVYNGYATDRVAAKIHFTEGLSGYFGSANRVSLKPLADPVLGDVLRIELNDDTNDPYVHFYAERLLAEADIKLSADDYRYMVVLARALPQNESPYMTFYLCAGSITGATEACTYTTALKTDGEWHYYLIDLTEKETWTGVIHGWRFDIINGNSHAGDAVDFASVQFFRTPQAARAAACRRIDASLAYRAGDPAVERDMSEEAQVDTLVIDPADTYLETHPETDPPTDPPEDPATAPATPPVTDAATEPGGPDKPVRGCASVAGGMTLLFLAAGAAFVYHSRIHSA